MILPTIASPECQRDAELYHLFNDFLRFLIRRRYFFIQSNRIRTPTRTQIRTLVHRRQKLLGREGRGPRSVHFFGPCGPRNGIVCRASAHTICVDGFTARVQGPSKRVYNFCFAHSARERFPCTFKMVAGPNIPLN